MKKIISVVLIVSLVSFSIFPKDKYEKVADEAYSAATGKSVADSSSKESDGLSTGAKIGIGAALVGGAALLLGAALSQDKYEKIADKAYEASKSE